MKNIWKYMLSLLTSFSIISSKKFWWTGICRLRGQRKRQAAALGYTFVCLWTAWAMSRPSHYACVGKALIQCYESTNADDTRKEHHMTLAVRMEMKWQCFFVSLGFLVTYLASERASAYLISISAFESHLVEIHDVF